MGAPNKFDLLKGNARAVDLPPVDPADLRAALSRHKSALSQAAANTPSMFEVAWENCFAHLSPEARFALRLRLQALVFMLLPARHGKRLILRASLLGAAAEADVWCIDQVVMFDPAELEKRAIALEAHPAPD